MRKYFSKIGDLLQFSLIHNRKWVLLSQIEQIPYPNKLLSRLFHRCCFVKTTSTSNAEPHTLSIYTLTFVLSFEFYSKSMH